MEIYKTKKKMEHFHISRDFLLFTSGILLISFASVNVHISPAPKDINSIPQNYDHVYCLPVAPANNDIKKEDKENIISSCNNSFI